MICEDAPCCGCCGHEVWAAEARSAEEYFSDPDNFYEEW